MPELVQIPVVPPPPKIPDKLIVGEVEHNIRFGPALTVASCLMTIFAESVIAGQAPLFVEVKVKETEPFKRSAGVREYEVIKLVVFGLKLPVPLLDQTPVLDELFTEPDKFIVPAFEQINWSGPALTVAVL